MISTLFIALVSSACMIVLPAQTLHAKLPPPVEQALYDADIDADNVSMIIVPISQLSYATTESENKKISALSVLSTEIEQTPPSTDRHSEYHRFDVSDDPEPFGEPLRLPVRHLTNVPRVPASTMKLIPTFIALDILGPEFKWVTKVYHTGIVINQTLYGDLIIKGSGDPKFTHQRLTTMLTHVQQSGIHHIKGDIVLDTSVFQKVSKDPSSFDNQPLRPYNASPNGLLINFNAIELTARLPQIQSQIKGQTHTAELHYEPKLADYNLPTLIATRSGPCSSLNMSLAPQWEANRLTFNKALPEACNSNAFYIAHPSAKKFAIKVVKQKWLALGNTLTGDVISTEQPRLSRFGNYLNMDSFYTDSSISAENDQALNAWRLFDTMPAMPLPFVTHLSYPLAQQIYDINHHSNNVMTEQLLLSLPVYGTQQTIGSASSSSHSYYQVGNYANALAMVSHWWQTHLTTPPPLLVNGSGLCRDCTVTADNIADLLEYAYHDPSFDVYLESLGVAGISGTIRGHRYRMPNSKAIGQAWIKTGTLDNVTSMAGYVYGNSGQDYIVVGIINGDDNKASRLDTNKARYVLDNMLNWAAKH